MDKYTKSLVDEIKETVEALEKHWVCKIDGGMYWTPRVGLKACFEVIQKRAEELEERCNNQWLKIQGDTEQIHDLEAKLALYEKDDFEDLYYKSIGQRKDLEAKLAESEKSNEYFADRVEKADKEIKENYKNYNKLVEEYNELKQQLAEKKQELKIALEDFNDIQKVFNQDNISFAVKKIQELKKSLRDKVCLMENDEHCYPQNAVHWQDVVALIDNQIKSIKDGK